MNSPVNALVWGQYQQSAVCRRRFHRSGGVAANYIAKWNSTSWTEGNYSRYGMMVTSMPLCATAPAICMPVERSPEPAALRSATLPNGIVTTSTWSAMGTGMNNSVNALAWDSTNNLLYAGGTLPRLAAARPITLPNGMVLTGRRWDWHE